MQHPFRGPDLTLADFFDRGAGGVIHNVQAPGHGRATGVEGVVPRAVAVAGCVYAPRLSPAVLAAERAAWAVAGRGLEHDRAGLAGKHPSTQRSTKEPFHLPRPPTKDTVRRLARERSLASPCT